jgi:hypothetical protein
MILFTITAVKKIMTTNKGTNQFSYENFIETIPSMFASVMQKATLCSMLWNEQSPETIIHNLRLYDLIRRLYYVKMMREGSDDDLLPLFKSVRSNPVMMEFFMHYIRLGKFPDTDIIGIIHDV